MKKFRWTKAKNSVNWPKSTKVRPIKTEWNYIFQSATHQNHVNDTQINGNVQTNCSFAHRICFWVLLALSSDNSDEYLFRARFVRARIKFKKCARENIRVRWEKQIECVDNRMQMSNVDKNIFKLGRERQIARMCEMKQLRDSEFHALWFIELFFFLFNGHWLFVTLHSVVLTNSWLIIQSDYWRLK